MATDKQDEHQDPQDSDVRRVPFSDPVPRGEGDAETPDLPDRGMDWNGRSTPNDQSDDIAPTASLEEIKNKVFGHNKDAIKSLNRVPTFEMSYDIAPRVRSFLLQKGYTDKDIQFGKVRFTPRLQAELTDYLSEPLNKSISNLSRWSQR